MNLTNASHGAQTRRTSGPISINSRHTSETSLNASVNTGHPSKRASASIPVNTRHVSEHRRLSNPSTIGPPTRRSSGPGSVGVSQMSEPATNSTVSTTNEVKAATTQPQPLQTSPTAATSEPSTNQIGSKSSIEYRPPLVMTPVSQISRGPRRNSRPEIPLGDRPSPFDPEHFNPDGSLRTIHKMPGFEESYSEAMKARYIRHRDPVAREKELSVSEIFAKNDK